jgi:hypothetical protein
LGPEIDGDRVRLLTRRGELCFEYLIQCIGFTVDGRRRSGLASLGAHVRRWRESFLPDGRDGYEQAEDPILGDELQFLEREAGTAPWVGRVHCPAFPAFMSHGPIGGDGPAISMGAERIATGIAGALFVEDYERNWARLMAWDTPDLTGEEYVIDEDVAKFVSRPSGRRRLKRWAGSGRFGASDRLRICNLRTTMARRRSARGGWAACSATLPVARPHAAAAASAAGAVGRLAAIRNERGLPRRNLVDAGAPAYRLLSR